LPTSSSAADIGGAVAAVWALTPMAAKARVDISIAGRRASCGVLMIGSPLRCAARSPVHMRRARRMRLGLVFASGLIVFPPGVGRP